MSAAALGTAPSTGAPRGIRDTAEHGRRRIRAGRRNAERLGEGALAGMLPAMPSSRLRIGLVFGGESPEHEVSIATARSIAEVIDREQFEVQPIGVAKNGVWLLKGDPFARLESGETPPAGPIPYLPLEAGAETTPLPDVFFMAIHGAGGEDGRMQGYLELLRRPYTGSGVLALAAGMDKWVARQIWRSVGLDTVPYLGITEGRWQSARAEVLRDIGPLGTPLFVKPANLGSSIGVEKVKSADALAPAIDRAFQFDRRVLVDTAIDAREIEVGVLGGDSVLASVPGEVIVADEFYTFHDKYVGGKSSTRVPADLTPALAERVSRDAALAFQSLDGYGMGRVDFFLCRRTGTLYLNEINFCPGFTSVSMYPKLMETVGVSYRELIARLITLAQARHTAESRRIKNFSSGSTWFRQS